MLGFLPGPVGVGAPVAGALAGAGPAAGARRLRLLGGWGSCLRWGARAVAAGAVRARSPRVRAPSRFRAAGWQRASSPASPGSLLRIQPNGCLGLRNQFARLLRTRVWNLTLLRCCPWTGVTVWAQAPVR